MTVQNFTTVTSHLDHQIIKMAQIDYKGRGTHDGVGAVEGSGDVVVGPAEDIVEASWGIVLCQSRTGIWQLMARRKGGDAAGVGGVEGNCDTVVEPAEDVFEVGRKRCCASRDRGF